MNNKRLKYLLDQYQKGHCTQEELAEVDDWYNNLYDASLPEKYIEGTPEAQAYTAQQYQKFQALQRRALGRRRRVTRLSVAAAVAAILILGALAVFVWKPFKQPANNFAEASAANRPYPLPVLVVQFTTLMKTLKKCLSRTSRANSSRI